MIEITSLLCPLPDLPLEGGRKQESKVFEKGRRDRNGSARTGKVSLLVFAVTAGTVSLQL